MSRSPQRVVLVTGAVTALLIAGLAVALLSSRSQSRSDLEQGFGQRATIAAALIESILDTTVQSSVEDNRAAFSARSVTTTAVREQDGVPGQTMVVASSPGRVLAAWPPAAGRRGAAVAAHLRPAVAQVLDGRDWALVVSPGAAGQVSTVSGFDTAYGRRVAISSFPRGLLQAFIGGYLGRIRSADDEGAYLVDASGVPLGSGAGQAADPSLRLPMQGAGTIELDGSDHHYATAAVGKTDWSVVVTSPESRLYAPVGGLSGWLPWALLVGVTLMAGLVMVLVRRLAHGSAELAEANHDLELRNQEVVAADRMKTDFLATMSHELRTPLNGIIGFAELMHDGRVGPVSDQHKEYLGDILASSGHLRRLIDDVLDLSKIEAGKVDLRPERTECGPLIEEVCDVVRSLAVRKRIHLDIDVDPTIDPLLLDPGKLKQVLFNYVSNALKFTPEGGTVVVRATREPDDRFRIEVEDDGPGIRPEDLGRVWSAFEQAESGSARRYGGTGLGLSLTRRLAEVQGGEVAVESTVGEGSRFSVVLPRVVAGPVREQPVAV